MALDRGHKDEGHGQMRSYVKNALPANHKRRLDLDGTKILN